MMTDILLYAYFVFYIVCEYVEVTSYQRGVNLEKKYLKESQNSRVIRML